MLDATERKTIVITTFVSACICFAPGEWVSGVALLTASGALLQWHRMKLAREQALAPKPPAALANPAPGPTSEPS